MKEDRKPIGTIEPKRKHMPVQKLKRTDEEVAGMYQLINRIRIKRDEGRQK